MTKLPTIRIAIVGSMAFLSWMLTEFDGTPWTMRATGGQSSPIRSQAVSSFQATSTPAASASQRSSPDFFSLSNS